MRPTGTENFASLENYGWFFLRHIYRFLRLVERTLMSKLYKIPVLKSFIGSSEINTVAGRERISREFLAFYQNERHFPDIAGDKGAKNFREW